MQMFSLTSEAGIRIDVFISSRIPSLSRSHAQRLINDGFVLVDGKSVKRNYVLRENQSIEISVPAAEPLCVVPEEIPLEIVYEDEWLLVVNKPQGLVVHPGAGNSHGTLVNALIRHCGGSLSRINGDMRPGIVHRLDKDTSGLLIVAKDNEVHLALASELKKHKISRKYIAIVHGNIKADSGTIDKPIGRHPALRNKMCVTDKNSRNAVTHFNVLERFGRYTFVECALETGRTHQIRVHLSSMGHPVAGDKVYGIKKEKFNLNGQMLHAKALGFTHPKTAEYMEFDSGLPERFEKMLNILKKK